MAATPATIIVKFPKFASEDVDWVTAMIAMATEVLNSEQFGTLIDTATELLACHFMQMENLSRDGASGAVVSRGKTETKVDGSSVSVDLSFAGGVASARKNSTDESLTQTVYGRSFITFRESAINLLGVVV